MHSAFLLAFGMQGFLPFRYVECCNVWLFRLQIISMEGYGTDAYLHLNRLGNVQEPLP